VELRIRDYGPFEGEHRIEFEPGKTMISGGGGSGKTTILNAIRACLHQEAVVNHHVNWRAPEAGRDTAQVAMIFDCEGNRYESVIAFSADCPFAIGSPPCWLQGVS
jgi:DNA repair exonuclease SbcCD ATPase subunit